MQRFSRLIRSDGAQDLGQAFMASVLAFSLFTGAVVYGSSVTLTATVATALTFTTSSSQFGTITPGNPSFATTTLDVSTNDTQGWNVVLSGGNKSTGNNNLQLAGNAASISDQTEWVPGAATSSVGNAARISSLVNSGNVLAFRVMTASTSNGVSFAATSWWGTADNYINNANTLWSGVSSSTVLRQIGNASVGSYSASDHLNTVLYYLNVAPTQPTGAYSAPLTYTATGN